VKRGDKHPSVRAASDPYRLLFENVGHMVCTLDLHGRFTAVNVAGTTLTGYSEQELIGRPAVDLVAPELRTEAVRRFERRLTAGADAPPDESILVTRDGRRVPVEVTSTLFTDEQGGPLGVLGLVRDVSDRKRDEEILLESEERFRSAFDYAAIGMALVAPDGGWLQVNRALCDLVGYSRDELLGGTFQDITHPDDLETDLGYVRQMLAGEIDTYQMEKRYFHKLGHVVWVLLSVSLVRASDGSPLYFISQIQDITARKHAHEALERSEAQLAEAQQIAQLASWERDASGAMSWSDEVYGIYGLDPDSGPPSEERLFELVHSDDRERVLAALERARRSRKPLSIEYRIVRADGGVRWIQSRGMTVAGKDGTFGRRVTAQDITERKEAEQRLAEAEQRYRVLVEQLPLGMYVRALDMSQPNIYASPQVEPMLGYPAAEWESNADLLAAIVHPDDRERVLGGAERVRATGEPLRDEYRYVRPDGRVVWVQDETYVVNDEHGEPAFVQGFLLDISERKQAEAERDRLREDLHHAQKLEAVGRLAGGVAHDFNNMLTAIKGYSELLLGALDRDDPLRAHAGQIRRAAEQAASLPRQLLAFSRKQTLQPELIDLNEIVSNISDLLRRLITESISLETEATEPALACVDASQLEQVLINLALNARDAMPDGGTLTIATRGVEIGEDLAAEHEAAVGRYAMISVSDTGLGIDPETRDKIFEPFFTTKATGQGSGLGLASVYGTVSQSGGFIRVESEPGEGARFEIYFPAQQTAGEPREGPARERRATGPAVLLAEDEEIVRDLAVSVLERAGFEVRAAANGRDAATLYEREADRIDVVVTDMVMPEMGGRALAERILERRPETPIIYMSGYTDEEPHAEAGTFLQKPFSAESLVQAVKDATASPTGITCVVADDHPAVLDAISHFLQSHGVDVVARVGTGDQALRAIADHKPVVALLDVTMQPLHGIEVARQARQLSPATRSIIYTGHRDPALLAQAIEAGAHGFLLKEAPLTELARALTIVAGGGRYVDAEVAGLVAAADGSPAAMKPLTKREQEILGHLASGKTNDKVAQELGISAETVQSHVRNAMGKLDADTRTEAVATALRQSLIA
jgi:two-component system cell cycle sensor histidine kinase/response regulator CckA